jgi:hypothetical protein
MGWDQRRLFRTVKIQENRKGQNSLNGNAHHSTVLLDINGGRRNNRLLYIL